MKWKLSKRDGVWLLSHVVAEFCFPSWEQAWEIIDHVRKKILDADRLLAVS